MEENDRIRIGDRVVVFRRGKKGTFCAEFSAHGQHRRQSLRTTNRKVAIARATELAASLGNGAYKPPVPPTSFAVAVKLYLESLVVESRSSKTLARYRTVLESLVA